jgi:hypothetical protein
MDVYYLTEERWALSNLEKGRIKVSRIDNLNDPYDFLLNLMSHNRIDPMEIRQHLNENYGMICFSECFHNPVYWSHYAGKHQGVCLKFEIDEKLLDKVEYVSEPPPVWLYGDLRGGDWNEIFYALRYKFDGWSYEKEWRYILSLDNLKKENIDGTDTYFNDFGKKLKLKEVIFGGKFNGNASRFVDLIRKYPDVKLFQSSVNVDEYHVVRGYLLN